MKTILTSALILLFSSGLFAQTARVQAIHNSADAAADTVDVWLTTSNGSVLLLDNFSFRSASPFVDAPADESIRLNIAAKNSTTIGDTIPGLGFNYTLSSGATYILIAEGIVSPIGYSPATPFDIKVYGMGREEASSVGNTDVLVHHGATDAPTVDVRERTAGIIVDDASFGDYAGYLELGTADYTLDVQTSDNSVTVASYSAPLSTLNLDDEALVVLASGFLNPSNNNNGPAFGLYVALASGGDLVALPTTAGPTARVQVIHNSADAAADSVDVYLDGSLLLDNFAFRTSTPFVDVPATKDIQIAIAAKNSSSVNDAIATFDYNLAIGETYIIVAEGIVSQTGYSPATPFDLKVYGMGREVASSVGNTDVLVHHGATDAPTVDVSERTAGIIVDDASFGDYAGYLELGTADYTLDVQTSDNSVTVASYSAPLATLNLDDQALVVLASGFLDPSNNSNGPAFGLYVALASGGDLVALPTTAGPTARVQVIHNSADAAADSVDVYLDGGLLLDNFAFRTSTPFVDVPATKDIQIAIAAKNSSSVNDAIATFDYNLAIGETYIIVAEGIVSQTGYSPATPFDLKVYGMGREVANTVGNTDVLVHHGSTDAPCVDVDEVTAGNLVNNACYGDFSNYLELPTDDYTLAIRDSAGGSAVAAFNAPLSTLSLDDQALVVLASGFFNPANNSDGPAFGLFVSLAAGGELVALPSASTASVININKTNITFYPNPAENVINISGLKVQDVQVSVLDNTGRIILESNVNANTSIDVSFLNRGSYHIILSKDSQILGTSPFIKL